MADIFTRLVMCYFKFMIFNIINYIEVDIVTVMLNIRHVDAGIIVFRFDLGHVCISTILLILR